MKKTMTSPFSLSASPSHRANRNNADRRSTTTNHPFEELWASPQRRRYLATLPESEQAA